MAGQIRLNFEGLPTTSTNLKSKGDELEQLDWTGGCPCEWYCGLLGR